LKEFEPKTERELPPNITVAWGRSTVAYGEITYRTPIGKHIRLHRVERAVDRQFSDDEWQDLLGDCIRKAKEHPDWQYHLTRLDHESFVEQNSNNEPFSQANGLTKQMEMFGFSFVSKA